MHPLLWIAAAVNLAAFMLYGLDKRKARLNRRRIRERTLLWAAALFGAAGAWCGMLVFRHKTKHRKFTLTVPCFFILQLILLIWVLV